MIKVTAIKCQDCGDTIYSRCRHDFHWCSCPGELNGIFCDGGFDYFRCGGKDIASIKPFQIEVDATHKELYDDWNFDEGKFGRIKDPKGDKDGTI